MEDNRVSVSKISQTSQRILMTLTWNHQLMNVYKRLSLEVNWTQAGPHSQLALEQNNVYTLVYLTDFDLKFHVVVAEHPSQHTLRVTSYEIKHNVFKVWPKWPQRPWSWRDPLLIYDAALWPFGLRQEDKLVIKDKHRFTPDTNQTRSRWEKLFESRNCK